MRVCMCMQLDGHGDGNLLTFNDKLDEALDRLELIPDDDDAQASFKRMYRLHPKFLSLGDDYGFYTPCSVEDCWTWLGKK